MWSYDFLSFLSNSKFLLKEHYDKPEKFIVILSSENSSTDTCASTLSLAFFRHSNRGAESCIYLPVLNMKRENFLYKTETVFLFSKLGICADSHLIFRNDISKLLLRESLLILIRPQFGLSRKNISEIYDYQAITPGTHLNSDCKRFTKTACSCAAIVAELYENPVENHAGVKPSAPYEMLYVAVLLENNKFQYVNLFDNSLDVKMARQLEHALGIRTPEQRNKIYEPLIIRMFDYPRISLSDLLRRQYKVLRTYMDVSLSVLVCCIPLTFEQYVTQYLCESSVVNFAVEKRCNTVVLLSGRMKPAGGIYIKELGLIPFNSVEGKSNAERYVNFVSTSLHVNHTELSMYYQPDLHFMNGDFFWTYSWKKTFEMVLQAIRRNFNEWVFERLNEWQPPPASASGNGVKADSVLETQH